jgi:hypothetical protein
MPLQSNVVSITPQGANNWNFVVVSFKHERGVRH